MRQSIEFDQTCPGAISSCDGFISRQDSKSPVKIIIGIAKSQWLIGCIDGLERILFGLKK